MEAAKRNGLLPSQNAPASIQDASDRLLGDMRAGLVRTRKGTPYRLRVIQNYEAAFRNRLLPAFGAVKVADLRRSHVQHFVNGLLAEGIDPSTVRNAINPLRVLYRRALHLGDVALSPCSHLELPAATGRRERVAAPNEARALLAALRPSDRALWGSAFYAGLRRGEIAALRWDAIDFEADLIHVLVAYDAHNRSMTDTKTSSGQRRLPLIPEMRTLLLEHRASTGGGTGLVFGTSATHAFTPTAVRNRALRAWKEAGLRPIKLHECRHTYASLLIAADTPRKALATYMGHAQVATTEDIYGHLFPGHEADTARRVQRYLDAGYVSETNGSRPDSVTTR
jgi:integrase